MRGLVRLGVWVVVALLVIGGAARLLLFEEWTIPDDPVLSASLAPTLAGGDTVLVLVVGTPEFGDLVRCPDPEEPERWVVGRIAGMPGDVVQVKGPLLTVNGKPYASTEACVEATFTVEHPKTGHPIEMRCDRVDMGSGWHFRGHLAKSPRHLRNEREKRVEEDHVFLLSDDRDLHDDSRDFSTVPLSSCKQRVVFRLWGKEGWADVKRRMTVIR